jgi:hypothetical protein
MAEVVGESDGFGKVFVELKGTGDVPRNRGDFDGVSQARAEVIAGSVEEDLGFILEAAKGAGMNDAVAVALILGAPFGGGFVVFAAARVGAELRVRREILALDLFEFKTGARHWEKVGGESSRFNIEHPITNIQHLMGNIEHRTLNAEHRNILIREQVLY